MLIMVLIVQTFAFAAAVSDNDGSAFITKAEFDSLKNNFQSQLDKYNKNIDNKIEGAISSYLAGVKASKEFVTATGFTLEGSSKKIVFVGKTNNYNNMNNTLYSSDRIFEVFCGTYATTAYYIQDTYDTFAFEGSWTQGNTSNYLFALDSDSCALSSKKNCQMNAARIYIGYSTTHANNGMFWVSITQDLNTPTEITNQSSAYISSTTANGYGMRRLNLEPSIYPVLLNHRMYSENGSPNGGIDQPLYRTNLETKSLTNVTQTCDVAITGSDGGTNLHWPNGSSYNIKTISKEWGSKDLIKSNSTSRTNYTYTYKLRNSGGYAASEVPASFSPTIKGYGIAWNFANKTFSNIYYKNIYNSWKQKLAYAGGVPICTADKKGKIKFSLSSNANVTMALTTQQNTTFPSGSDARFRKFKSKRSTETNYQQRTTPVDFTSGITYDFEVELNAKETLFLTLNMASSSSTVTITQVGDAIMTEEG